MIDASPLFEEDIVEGLRTVPEALLFKYVWLQINLHDVLSLEIDVPAQKHELIALLLNADCLRQFSLELSVGALERLG